MNALPPDFYISPTPEALAARALAPGFRVEAAQLGISTEKLLAALVRASPGKTCYKSAEIFTHAGNVVDCLTSSEWERLAKWFADPQRKPAMLAFTAGACRDAATAFEHSQSMANKDFGG